MKKVLLCLVLLSGSLPVWAAGGLDLSLSSDAASLNILLKPRGTTELSVGGLINETGDNIFNATLLARGARVTEGGLYNLGAGLRFVGGDLDVDETVGALAIGFQATILLAPSRFNPTDLIVEGFYAPSISSFTDAEEYSEIGARIQIDVVPAARAYIGYRRMAFDTNDFNNVTIDKSVHAGLSIRF